MTETIKEDPKLIFFRLRSGEDIIALARFNHPEKDGEDAWFDIIQPLKIIYMANPFRAGQMGITLIEWIFDKIVTTKEFMIYTQDIVTFGQPSEWMVDNYHEAIEGLEEIKNQYLEDNDFAEEMDTETAKEILKLQGMDPETPVNNLDEFEQEIMKEYMKEGSKNTKRTLH